jgi:hypothetical protein
LTGGDDTGGGTSGGGGWNVLCVWCVGCCTACL